MLQRFRHYAERARASLFFVPAVFVLVAIAAAGSMLETDAYLSERGIRLPAFLESTSESARSLLSTIAAATITVAGVVFAITLVSIQLASSQFSPRVIPGFLRDSRQQRVMGLSVGTFTYSLVVLRAIRGQGGPGSLFIPHASSALSLVLAIVTILALIAFLDRSARTMQVGTIIHRLTEETTPGVNDPTTAYDVIVHLGVVVRELLWRDLAPVVRAADGRRLVTAGDLSHGDYVNRAFDQIRLAGAAQSAIAATLMQTLGGIAADLERDGLADRATSVQRQGALTLAIYEASSPLADDLARIHALAERHGFAS